MFSLIFAWTNGWAKNRDTVDMIRHRTHYDLIVTMFQDTILRQKALQWDVNYKILFFRLLWNSTQNSWGPHVGSMLTPWILLSGQWSNHSGSSWGNVCHWTGKTCSRHGSKWVYALTSRKCGNILKYAILKHCCQVSVKLLSAYANRPHRCQDYIFLGSGSLPPGVIMPQFSLCCKRATPKWRMDTSDMAKETFTSGPDSYDWWRTVEVIDRLRYANRFLWGTTSWRPIFYIWNRTLNIT